MITNTPYTEMNGGFFILPNWLGLELTKLGVKPTERLIYITLLRFANNSENNPHPGYAKLMEHTGISSTATISACIKNLEKKGLIEKIHKGKRQGDSNIYKVNYVYSEDCIESCNKPQEGFKQSKSGNAPKNTKEGLNGLTMPYRRGVQSNGLTAEENQKLIEDGEGFLIEQDYSNALAMLD